MAARFTHNRAMPELPEVEVTRRALEPVLEGARITELHLGKPLRWPLRAAPEDLSGLRIDAVRRRGKYLLLHTGRGCLIVHLGMSGALLWTPASQSPPPRGPHEHAELLTDRGVLRLRDPRRFGAVIWHAGAGVDAHPLLRVLGPEPLDAGFGGATLQHMLSGRTTAIKLALLAQHLVAGVGNIYASEALFRAGIDPRTPALRLGRAHCDRLGRAVRETLDRAVALGGSTLRDFAHSDGEAGCFQFEAQVYGRAGEPCRVCGTPIRQIRQGQRSTFFCPNCQKLLKPRRRSDNG